MDSSVIAPIIPTISVISMLAITNSLHCLEFYINIIMQGLPPFTYHITLKFIHAAVYSYPTMDICSPVDNS